MIQKHILYLGLNDKDTKLQKYDQIEAYKIVTNILAKDFGGGTIFSAQGVYTHDDGTIVIENTLRIEVLFSDDAKIKVLVSELKKIFNQESIAVESSVVNSTLM